MTTEDRIARALDALGVAGPVTPEGRKEAVYGALVQLWTDKGGPPTLTEVAKEAGVTKATVDAIVKSLLEEERVARLAHGVWLPIDL